jgi:hypothetical protein
MHCRCLNKSEVHVRTNGCIKREGDEGVVIILFLLSESLRSNAKKLIKHLKNSNFS